MDEFYDELFLENNQPRPECRSLVQKILSFSEAELRRKNHSAQQVLFRHGATFHVYGHDQAEERILPFDIIPRIIPADQWAFLERGLKQRIQALNLLIDDIYHDQKLIRDGIIPREIVESSNGYLKSCRGLNPPNGVWCHITGTDIVRDRGGQFYVLEDNLRCPSGVSYVLENRRVMKSIFPQIFQEMKILPVDQYPSELLDALLNLVPDQIMEPTVALLTPGLHNSAYFEHSYLAQQMGIELVEGRDLIVADGYLQMRTTRGLKRVDVLYRRLDDNFLDPRVFNPSSMLGVPGLMDVYQSGRLAIANAPGTGVADDKVIYAYIPEAIRYFLDQEPILANVPTYLCWREDDLKFVLDHLDQLVVKAASEAGGYGMLIGTQSTQEERQEFRQRILDNPRNYIAQPTLCLSRVPTLLHEGIEGCHVDLRPYVLYGNDIYVHPGGLTRVALKRGSLVVNSSQGGGTKDTWVLRQK
ncbi:MAG: circularly permuted type 2 ATP-grasp protein [Cyanobacteria bacterium P01_F01_bin.42]